MTTIHEVAKKAGVSSTTVSHVINNTRYVSPVLRERVEQAMVELNYKPNALARSLRLGQTHTLGLILPDSANPFFAEIGHAIESAAFERGYSVILCNTENDQTKELLYTDEPHDLPVDAFCPDTASSWYRKTKLVSLIPAAFQAPRRSLCYH